MKAGDGARGLIKAGIDPNNGQLLWQHPHKTSWDLNIALPVWGEDGILVVSSAYGTGSRGLKLTRSGSTTTVKELWSNNRMRVHHTTMVRIGDYIYGSSGDFGPAPLTAINAKTGEIKWQKRTFPKASFVYADGKFIVVDEDGAVSLATFSPEGPTVISKVHLLESNAWTAPSLAGTKPISATVIPSWPWTSARVDSYCFGNSVGRGSLASIGGSVPRTSGLTLLAYGYNPKAELPGAPATRK